MARSGIRAKLSSLWKGGDGAKEYWGATAQPELGYGSRKRRRLLIILFLLYLLFGKRKTRSLQGYGDGYGGGYSAGRYTPKEKGYGEEVGVRRAREGRFAVWWDLYGKSIAKILFVIGLLIGIFFLFTAKSFAGVRENLGMKGEVELANLGVVKFFTSIPNKISTYWKKYFEGISVWENPDYQNQEAILEGVTIENFHAVKQEFFEGEDIELLAVAVVDPLEKDSSVSFGCGVEKSKGGSVTVVGKEEGDNKANIPKNTKKRVPVVCKIPAYDKIEQDYKSTKVFLNWTYENFETKTALRAFTLSSDEKKRRDARNEDIMRRYKGREYIDSDGFSRDVCVNGCGLTDLGLKLNAENPLIENSEYYLEMALVGIIYGKRKGDLKRLDLLKIQLPESITLGEGGCRGFERGDPLVFDVYDAGFERLNQNLTSKKENTYSFTCKIRVEQSGVSEELNPKTIVGVAVYDYGDTEFLTIDLRKKGVGELS